MISDPFWLLHSTLPISRCFLSTSAYCISKLISIKKSKFTDHLQIMVQNGIRMFLNNWWCCSTQIRKCTVNSSTRIHKTEEMLNYLCITFWFSFTVKCYWWVAWPVPYMHISCVFIFRRSASSKFESSFFFKLNNNGVSLNFVECFLNYIFVYFLNFKVLSFWQSLHQLSKGSQWFFYHQVTNEGFF